MRRLFRALGSSQRMPAASHASWLACMAITLFTLVGLAHSLADAQRQAVDRAAAEARSQALAWADRQRQAHELDAYRRGYAAAQLQRCARRPDSTL